MKNKPYKKTTMKGIYSIPLFLSILFAIYSQKTSNISTISYFICCGFLFIITVATLVLKYRDNTMKGKSNKLFKKNIYVNTALALTFILITLLFLYKW